MRRHKHQQMRIEDLHASVPRPVNPNVIDHNSIFVSVRSCSALVCLVWVGTIKPNYCVAKLMYFSYPNNTNMLGTLLVFLCR